MSDYFFSLDGLCNLAAIETGHYHTVLRVHDLLVDISNEENS